MHQRTIRPIRCISRIRVEPLNLDAGMMLQLNEPSKREILECVVG